MRVQKAGAVWLHSVELGALSMNNGSSVLSACSHSREHLPYLGN